MSCEGSTSTSFASAHSSAAALAATLPASSSSKLMSSIAPARAIRSGSVCASPRAPGDAHVDHGEPEDREHEQERGAHDRRLAAVLAREGARSAAASSASRSRQRSNHPSYGAAGGEQSMRTGQGGTLSSVGRRPHPAQGRPRLCAPSRDGFTFSMRAAVPNSPRTARTLPGGGRAQRAQAIIGRAPMRLEPAGEGFSATGSVRSRNRRRAAVVAVPGTEVLRRVVAQLRVDHVRDAEGRRAALQSPGPRFSWTPDWGSLPLQRRCP